MAVSSLDMTRREKLQLLAVVDNTVNDRIKESFIQIEIQLNELKSTQGKSLDFYREVKYTCESILNNEYQTAYKNAVLTIKNS